MKKTMRLRRLLVTLTVSHGLIHIFSGLLTPLLPLIRLEYGLSYTMLGIISFLPSLVWALGSIPMGMVVDRTNRIRLISVMFLCIGVSSILFLFAGKLYVVLSLLLFTSLSLSIFHPSAQSYLSGRYSKGRGQMFGIYEAGGTIGSIFAALSAAFIGLRFNWRVAYGVWTVPLICMALYIYRISKLEDSGRGWGIIKFKIRRFVGKTWKALNFAFKEKELRSVYLFQILGGFTLGGVTTFLPVFLVDVHNFPIDKAGYTLGLFLVGTVIGKLLGGKLSDLKGRMGIIISSFLLLVPLLFLGPFLPGALLIILSFCMGVLSIIHLPVITTLLGESKGKELGFNYGLQVFVRFGSFAMSRLFLGVLSDIFGVVYIFPICAAVVLCGSLIAIASRAVSNVREGTLLETSAFIRGSLFFGNRY